MIRCNLRWGWFVLVVGVVLLRAAPASALGDGSTHFQVFVPPNASTISRYVILSVTAVSDQPTNVDIVDDGADGDTDDTVHATGLQRGQSYVVAIKDGLVNDDAGGKADGDYFIIDATHPVVVQMATSSSWQHDFAPSENKTSIGTSFFIYNPTSSSSANDLDVFAYSPGTVVTVTDLTVTPRLGTGLTSVRLTGGALIFRATLEEGEDTFRRRGLGIDVLLAGHTYWVQATKPVTVQYGALDTLGGTSQARDGGGFVPSVNGSSSGDLFYFGIPHDPERAVEKELRVACFDNGSVVTLSGWSASGWTEISASTVAAHAHLDFVGATNALFSRAELYRLTVNAGHRCSVFEANWLETGNSGTSDMGSYVAAANGRNLGTDFMAYIAPPGDEATVAGIGGSYSHLYVFLPDEAAGAATVTVTDADTAGATYTATASILPGRYTDIRISKAQYTALSSSSRRPYLRVAASQNVNVFDTNFNDNWNTFVYSTLDPAPTADIHTVVESLVCGDSTTLNLGCSNGLATALSNAVATLALPPGVTYVPGSATLAEPTIGAASGGQLLSWGLGTLNGLSSTAINVGVRFDCSAQAGCGFDGLGALALECAGRSAGASQRSYASKASSLLQLRASQRNLVTGLRGSYAGTVPTLSFEVGPEDGTASYVVTRAASPTAAATKVTTLLSRGPSTTSTTYTMTDATAALGTSYFYRVAATAAGCSTTYGPVAPALVLEGSSGNVGGLESNGRLSAALARRAVVRARQAAARLDAPSARTAPASERLLYAPASSLAEFAPAVGPRGSLPVDVSPTDLTGVTNAADVFSVDYVGADGTREASLFVVETRGELYEHSKALCDRAHGAELTSVETRSFQTGDLVGMLLVNPTKKTADYGMEFRLYEQESGGYAVHSGWLNEDFPVPRSGQRIISIQAWSHLVGGDTSLVQSVLDSMPLVQNAPYALPEAYFFRASALGSRLRARLKLPSAESATQLKEIRVTRLLAKGELATSTIPLDSLIDAGNGYADLDTRLPPFREATLELDDLSGRAVDRAWVFDGAWTLFDDTLSGGASHVTSFKDVDCEGPGPSASDSLALAGCGTMKAEVDGYAGVARTFAGAYAPLDLTVFRTMRFWVQSETAVKVCIEADVPTANGSPCALVQARPTGGFVSLRLSSLGVNAPCTPVSVTNAGLVSFTVAGPGTHELQVGNLSFSAADLENAAGDGCGERPVPAMPADASVPTTPRSEAGAEAEATSVVERNADAGADGAITVSTLDASPAQDGGGDAGDLGTADEGDGCSGCSTSRAGSASGGILVATLALALQRRRRHRRAASAKE